MNRIAFNSLREQFRRDWSRNHSIIVWCALAVFCIVMTASLSVEPQERWAFAIVAAAGLLGVLIFSTSINARLLRDSRMKCPNCDVIFFEHRSDVVMASGNCPECGYQVITESSAAAPPSAAAESRSTSDPHAERAR